MIARLERLPQRTPALRAKGRSIFHSPCVLLCRRFCRHFLSRFYRGAPRIKLAVVQPAIFQSLRGGLSGVFAARQVEQEHCSSCILGRESVVLSNQKTERANCVPPRPNEWSARRVQ